MKKVLIILVVTLSFYNCEKVSKAKETQPEATIQFNQDLADELKKMAKIDQIAAYIPQGEYKKMSTEEWKSFKDSVFTTHQKRLKQIFEKYGFVGFDLAGEDGSSNFWLMVQHSDHNPSFQKEVLEKMKLEVDKGNAASEEYGLLVDRVRLNTGGKQVYGTQVAYNMETGQAYPKSLEDSLHVNERRKSIGLNTLEEYLNSMTEMHFMMNKEYYLEKGIKEPTFYTIKK